MMRPRALDRNGEAGFSLIETLIALALMGFVLSSLATITAQWLPAWNRGVDRIQRTEMLGLALRRISEDLAAAEFVYANREQRQPLFEGSELAVTLVRTAIGPNAPRGLEVVRIGETANGRDLLLLRSRARFAPSPVGASPSDYLHLTDPVVLLGPPFRLSFAYADRDLVWQPVWHDADRLPAMVRVTVRDGASTMSSVVAIHIDAPAKGCIEGEKDCVAGNAESAPTVGAKQPGSVPRPGDE
jgi:general secretion pathway protein J